MLVVITIWVMISVMVQAVKKFAQVTGTRIMETLIIGIVVTLGLKLLAIDALQTRIDQVTTSVTELKSTVEGMRRDLYIPKTEIRRERGGD